MNQALTDDERWLLRHAISCGGWLSTTGIASFDEHRQTTVDLVRAGLFEFADRVPGKTVARYVVTDAGYAAAN